MKMTDKIFEALLIRAGEGSLDPVGRSLLKRLLESDPARRRLAADLARFMHESVDEPSQAPEDAQRLHRKLMDEVTLELHRQESHRPGIIEKLYLRFGNLPAMALAVTVVTFVTLLGLPEPPVALPDRAGQESSGLAPVKLEIPLPVATAPPEKEKAAPSSTSQAAKVSATAVALP